MRFRYDSSLDPNLTRSPRSSLAISLRVISAIDISDTATELYGFACNLYLGLVLASIPKKTDGALPFPGEEGRHAVEVACGCIAPRSVRSLFAAAKGHDRQRSRGTAIPIPAPRRSRLRNGRRS